MGTWWLGLIRPDIEDKAAELTDLVEQPVRQLSDLWILTYIPDCVKTGTLLFPLGWGFAGPLDLPLEKLAFTLEKPGAKLAHALGRQDETRQAENRTVVVFEVFPADIGAMVAKFVQVREVGHRTGVLQTTRKPALMARASERGKAAQALLKQLASHYHHT